MVKARPMLIVQKYGGTSVGSGERIRAVAERVLRTQQAGNRVVVIVSAMSGETNRLVDLARSVDPDGRSQREMDVLLATGEQASVALLSMAINHLGGQAVSFLGHQIKVLTDSAFSRARIRRIDGDSLASTLERSAIPIVAGFQGTDPEGNITTLGRGGSDTSAVAIAAAVKADVCEIYTDVEGVCTTDPNVCPEAQKIHRITYQEMLELASLGAKVLQIRSVEVASKFGVRVHVRSSFNDNEGTWVISEEPGMEDKVVSGVTLDRDQARISVLGLPAKAGVQAAVFQPLAEAGIVVDVIVQDPPVEGKSTLSFTVAQADVARTLELVRPAAEQTGAQEVVSDRDLAKVSIVGVGMRSRPGVAQEMFAALARDNINIHMISTSEIKVSCIIPRQYGELAVRILHNEFRLGDPEAI